MPDNYILSEIISFLENKNFESFRIAKDHVSIYSNNGIEIVIEAESNKISAENTELAIKVLKNLNECVSLAHKWLEHFNLKNDKWHPDALDEGFEVNGIYFGKYGYGHWPMLTKGFNISFSTKNYYPCDFTVKFHENMWPFAVEEWVE